MGSKKNIDRALKLAVTVILIVVLFTVVNARQVFFSATLALLLLGVIFFFYKKWDTFGRKGQLVGIGDHIGMDVIVGLVLVAVTYFGSKLSPVIGAIGVPDVPVSVAGDLGRFLMIVIAFPILEELLFRDFILDLFDNKLFNGKILTLVAIVLSSALFSLFHLTAYGDSLVASQGSFITAFFMGIGFATARHFRKSNTSNIIWHMGVNAFIILPTLAVIG